MKRAETAPVIIIRDSAKIAVRSSQPPEEDCRFHRRKHDNHFFPDRQALECIEVREGFSLSVKILLRRISGCCLAQHLFKRFS